MDRPCYGLKMEWLLDGMLNAENWKEHSNQRDTVAPISYSWTLPVTGNRVVL